MFSVIHQSMKLRGRKNDVSTTGDAQCRVLYYEAAGNSSGIQLETGRGELSGALQNRTLTTAAERT